MTQIGIVYFTGYESTGLFAQAVARGASADTLSGEKFGRYVATTAARLLQGAPA